MKNILPFLVSFFAITNAFAQEPITINKSGKFSCGKSFTITIIERNYIKTPNSKEDDGSLWGTDGGYPSTVIETFDIDINDVAVFIPWKFYSDLSSIHKADFEKVGDAYILTVEGGDAAGSFDAYFKIKNFRMIERTVKMGEFPDEVWEKTVLHNELWDNKDM